MPSVPRGEERRRLVEKLIRELPKLDPFEGHAFIIWLARLVARTKLFGTRRLS